MLTCDGYTCSIQEQFEEKAHIILENLERPNEAQDTFYTDSTTVLGYISNESKRFHTFVANRVQQIRGLTDVSRWFYVSSEENPADVASRGSITAIISLSPFETRTGNVRR